MQNRRHVIRGGGLMSHALTTNVLDWMFSRAFRTHLAGKGAIFDLTQLNTKFKPLALIFLPLMTFFGRGFSQEVAVSFKLDIALERAKEGEWNLILDLDLDPGEWVVSSCSTDSMYGKVALWFHESQITEPSVNDPLDSHLPERRERQLRVNSVLVRAGACPRRGTRLWLRRPERAMAQCPKHGATKSSPQ